MKFTYVLYYTRQKGSDLVPSDRWVPQGDVLGHVGDADQAVGGAQYYDLIAVGKEKEIPRFRSEKEICCRTLDADLHLQLHQVEIPIKGKGKGKGKIKGKEKGRQGREGRSGRRKENDKKKQMA
jgi:hypothetical protein